MSDRPFWFDGSVVGAVLTFLLMGASAYAGIGLLLLNIVAFACFLVPVIAALRDGDLDPVGIRPRVRPRGSARTR